MRRRRRKRRRNTYSRAPRSMKAVSEAEAAQCTEPNDKQNKAAVTFERL